VKETVLITGGCGFVGSNLVEQLVIQGYQVRVLDSLITGRAEYISNLGVELIQADIGDIDSCKKAFSGVDKVVHLAALGSVVDSVVDPISNFKTNVEGTFNVLKMCVDSNVRSIIFSSTGGALIGEANPPVNESSLPKPISPYGASKLCCEAYCHAFAKSYGINAIALRFANVYGKNSAHKKGVVNKFTQRIRNKEPLVIYGDGSSTRDYIHVSDLCNGIQLALKNDALENEVIHLATGKETSLIELARIFLDIGELGEDMIEYHPSRVGEVERNFALYDRAAEVLGYKPEVDLKTGMAETFRYLKEFY